ncbi:MULTISPECIES: glycosyltransferase [unclassified Novosphingobium]|uniref:glycosyltransferase n=1 Tax=unclassified Novosphingobium TaxID=2644732 RepID=UPI0025EA6457|nr:MULTISPECIES: glycosyltransferase [unclassified Novosphingobium]HQV04020.1 glycosyltransferase [Novosphingobium sp.]
MTGHRFLVWGTFDTGKPRVRMLVEALRLNDPALPVIHCNPWAGIEDKSQVKGLAARLALLLRWLLTYPALIAAYLRAPRHEVVVVPYPGNLDVLVLWPLARLRGAKICWDMFLSLYDTAVIDRAMVGRGGMLARLIRAAEWLSTRAADRILLDSRAHADYIADLFHLPAAKVGAFQVGAETELFVRAAQPPATTPLDVLFYGQFIPLHGLDTIIAAIAQIEQDETAPPLTFTIVGQGQEQPRIDALIARQGLRSVKRTNWVDFADLPALIDRSSFCLGVFARDGKGTRVIPNKVFQILSVGRPLITMDSPAIRELVSPGPALRLVPPGDAAALADAILSLARDLSAPGGAAALHQSAIAAMPRVGASAIGAQFLAATESL